MASSDRDTSTLCLFDVDGTLTPARKVIEQDVSDCLSKLKSKVLVGLVGGSDFDKIYEQMGGGGDLTAQFDYVFAENGLVAYKGTKLIGQQDIKKHVGEETLQKLINFALGYLSKLQLPCKRGTFVEFRNGMINFCPVGRSCSQQEREEFVKFDTINHVRESFVKDLRVEFPEAGLTFAIGGQISIDVFPTGWDKSFALQFIPEESIKTIHFFGDKTDKGGNDHEIYDHPRTIGHKVVSPQDTIQQLTDVFSL